MSVVGPSRRTASALVALATFAAALVAVVPAGAQRPVDPVGPGPVEASLDDPQRYVDPVFADVEVTRGLGYATVTNVEGRRQRLRLDLYEPAGDTGRRWRSFLLEEGGKRA